MKTINIFVNSFPKTSETFIYNKVKGLLKNGFKINLLVSQIETSDYKFYEDLSTYKNFKIKVADINRAKSIKTLITSLFSTQFWSIFIRSNFKLKSSYKKHLMLKSLNYDNPDIIHFEFSGIGFKYLPYFKLLKNKIIGSSFRGAAEKIKPLIDDNRRIMFPLFLKSIHYYHCVSKDMFNELHNYGASKDKLFLNYPSIEVEKFSFLKKYTFKNNPTIISVGRLHWKKGIDIALLALSKLKKEGFNFTYKIIGNGNEYEKLKFLTNKLGLTKNVIFEGFCSSKDVAEKLKKAQIFLLPSYSEGLSNSALEAMCSGIPIVSAKAGGMEEAITHKQNGFLFTIGDSEELYTILKDILNNKFDLEKIRINASSTVSNKFNLTIQEEKFKNFYNKL